MTSPYMSFAATRTPSPTPTPRPSAWPVLRAMLAVVVVVLGVLGALMAAFASVVVWSGCFISCTGANHRDGGLLALLAVVSLASGPAAVSGLYRSGRWMWVAAGTAVAGGLFMAFALTTA
jgi:hypothetical protein